MHPPSFVCRSLFRLDPQIRLAWMGRKPAYQGELNPGSFCLVQLWHRDHYGSYAKPNTPNELWNVRPKIMPLGKVELVRAERGPVFSKDGSIKPDWNPFAYELVYRANLRDFGISTEEVLSGAMLRKIERFYRPMKERMEEDRRQHISAVRDTAERVGREAGMRLYQGLQQHDIRLPVMTREDVVRDVRQHEEARQRRNAERLF